MFEDKYVGYQPNEIFSNLAHGASLMSWGGEIYSTVTELSPPMGSGHFPEEGYRRSLISVRLKSLLIDHKIMLILKMMISKCTLINLIAIMVDRLRGAIMFYFGGPGNSTF